MLAPNYIPTLAPAPEPAGPSPEALALQQAYAKQLLAGNDQPIHSWSQGLAGIVDALVGGTIARKSGEKQAAGEASAADQFSQLLMGGTPAPVPETAGGDISGLSAMPMADGGAAPVVSPPAATGAPAISAGQITALLKNPFASPTQKAMALELWKAAHPAPVVEKPTDDMREYTLARQQGYTGSFRDYMIEQKQAGRNVMTVDQRGENAESKARGEAIVKHFGTLAEDLPAADQLLEGADRLEVLLNDVDVGSTAGLTNFLQKNLGIPVGENADKVQAVSSLVDYMAPRMRVPGSGSSSDIDVQMFKNSLPSLMGTKEGNALIIGTIRTMGEHRLAIAQISQDYLTGGISSQDALAKMRDLPDPMADFKKAAPAAAPETPSTPAVAPSAGAAPLPGWSAEEWSHLTPEEQAQLLAKKQGASAAAPIPAVSAPVPPVGVIPPVPNQLPLPPGARPPPVPTGDPFLDSPMRVRR